MSGQSVISSCSPPVQGPCRDLLALFADLPDPRRRRGVRHAASAVLAIAAVAVLGGARSFTAIGEWAADAPQWLLQVLGARLDPGTGRYVPPHEATLRRKIQAFDADVLDVAISRWLAAADLPFPLTDDDPDSGSVLARAIALDGKTIRGARREDGS